MIKYFFSLTLIAATVISCNQSPAGDKRAELEALKLGPDWRVIRPGPEVKVWTDDYSNVLDAILTKMRASHLRAKM